MFDTQLTRLSLLLLISVSTPCSARVTESWDEEGVGKGCIVSDLNDLSSNEIKNLISESSSLRLHIPNHEPDIKDVKKLLGKEYKVTTEEDSFGCYNGAVYIVTKDGPIDSDSEKTKSQFRLYRDPIKHFIGYMKEKDNSLMKGVKSFHVNGNAGNLEANLIGGGLNGQWRKNFTDEFRALFVDDVGRKQSDLLGKLKENEVVTEVFENEETKPTRSYKVLYGCGRNNKEAEKYVGGSVMLGIFQDDRRMDGSIGHLYMTGTREKNFFQDSLRIVARCASLVIAAYNKANYPDKIKYALIPFINGGIYSMGEEDARAEMADIFVKALLRGQPDNVTYIMSQGLTNSYLEKNPNIESEQVEVV